MNSNKPYLIKALYEWISDNDCTPYIYIDTRFEQLLLPTNLLAETPLVLNISPTACQQLHIDNEAIAFQARFSGKVFDVYLPMDSVMAIIARENGQGMTFETAFEETAEDSSESMTTTASDSNSDNKTTQGATTKKSEPSKSGQRPKSSGLKVIK